jgi:aminoglycoside 6'-N-acetyltransferase I
VNSCKTRTDVFLIEVFSIRGLGMKIIDLDFHNEQVLHAAAAILVDAFLETAPGCWPDLQSGLEEVREFIEPERIARCAVNEQGKMLGWIGGIRKYDGHAWELHPLAVSTAYQGQGVGRALVNDFEEQVRQQGGLTIFLGTDDETGATSLSGVDLYPDPWKHIECIQNLKHHPYAFYLKMGYIITGVVPDANGWGKPDILMSKRVSAR